jgi:membrane protease YdiL (CAAX protease family)
VNPDLWQARLAAFLRSVLPADPSQLLFLAGIVCLIFAPRLSWWPAQLNESFSRLGIDKNRAALDGMPYMVLATYTFLFSALAGYYFCFRPSLRPAKRVFFLTLLPALGALPIAVGRFAISGSPYSSILEKTFSINLGNPLQWTGWSTTPGFHTAFAGLLLIGIFTSRMIFGISTLPLALPEVPTVQPSDPQLWSRIQILLWVLIGPLFMVSGFLGVPLVVALSYTPYAFGLFQDPWLVRTFSAVEALAYLGIVYWIVGKEGRAIIKSSIRFFQPKYFFLASAISIGIPISISIGHYVVDRSSWAAHHFGEFAPPHLASYFDLPHPWSWLMFFGALFEELIFRGILQTIFVRRYGLYRGIFLVGVIWAAYHFNFDAVSHPTEIRVLAQVAYRLFMCVSLGYVLGWLTIRSGSIIPAAIAHTFYNVLISDFGPYFFGKATLQAGIWAVLAYLLFRYWPVQNPNEPEAPTAIPDPEPAV